MSTEVVIAGAGPVGLMLAAELALQGVVPIVLERRDGPGAEPKANGLVGQIVPLLDRRDLYAPLAGEPGPPEPNRSYFFFGGLPLDLGLLADSPVYTLPVPQHRIVEVLAARAVELGARIRWGHELVGFTRDDDLVVAEVSGPDGDYDLGTRYLVGAEGAHSTVRKAAGIGFPGIGLDRMTTYAAHVTVPDELAVPGGLRLPGGRVARPFLPERTLHGGFTYAPLPGGPPLVSTLEWDRPPGPATWDGFRESLRRVLGDDVGLQPPTGDGPHLLRRLDGGQIRVAERFRDGRVFLAGDAAHVYSGGGGPGLNLGLQDALNLGWKLAAHLRGAPESLLDGYGTERSAAAHRVVTYSRAQAALLAPGEDVDGLRSLFGELMTDPTAAARLATMIAGTDVRYPIADDAHHDVGYPARDRVVRTADGPVRLAEAARSGRWVLVDPTPDGRLAALVDGGAGGRECAYPTEAGVGTTAGGGVGDGAIRTARPLVLHGTADGRGPAAVLVRPDGYLAWACDAADPDDDDVEALRQCVTRWAHQRVGATR